MNPFNFLKKLQNRCTLLHTANEGPVRIQYKCLVSIYVFSEVKLLLPKQNYNVLSPSSYTYISVERFIYFRIGLLILLQGKSLVYLPSPDPSLLPSSPICVNLRRLPGRWVVFPSHMFHQRVLNDSYKTMLSCDRMIWLLAPPLSRQQIASLTQSSCVSPVLLTDGRGGGVGRAWSRIIRPQETRKLGPL
jgi:hypothetical protein